MLASAEPSLAARREARRLGIAMAAMMPIIATTMSNSIKEKPCWRFCVFISFLMLLKKVLVVFDLSATGCRLSASCRNGAKVCCSRLSQGPCRFSRQNRRKLWDCRFFREFANDDFYGIRQEYFQKK